MRYPVDHLNVSMGVFDQYCGRSTTYVGLLRRWEDLDARLDQHSIFLDGAAVVLSCHIVTKVEGIIIWGDQELPFREEHFG